MKSVNSKQEKQPPRSTYAGLFSYDCSAKMGHVSPAVQFTQQTRNNEFRRTLNGHHSLVTHATDDLRQEAVNMLELTCSQFGRKTPLCISSKGAQAVLKQF